MRPWLVATFGQSDVARTNPQSPHTLSLRDERYVVAYNYVIRAEFRSLTIVAEKSICPKSLRAALMAIETILL